MVAQRFIRAWRGEGQGLSPFFALLLGAGLAWLIATLPLEMAALLVLGTIFVVLVLVEPRWGLYALPFAVPFGSIREVSIGPATVGGTEALLGLFLAAWLARGVARRELRLARPPLLGAILLWYGIMLLSTLQSLSLAASVKELVKWGETFALYAIAAQELRRRDIAIVVATTLVAGTLAAAEGIYQSIFRVGPEGFLFPLAGRLWLRAYGRFIQPNPYAGYLGVVLPLAYGVFINGKSKGKRQKAKGKSNGRPPLEKSQPPRAVPLGMNANNKSLPPFYVLRFTFYALGNFSDPSLRLLAAGAAGVMGLALFLTLSRGAWIGAVGAAVAVGVLLSRRAALLSLFLGIALALGFSLGLAQRLPEALSQRATDFLPYINVFNIQVRGIEITNENFAIIERLAHWQAGYEMWAASPWLGQGVGNYAAAYPAFRIPPWEEPLGHAHNLFLNTLAETGLLGLGGYLLFWGGSLWLAFRAVRQSAGVWQGIAVGVLGAMVHLHIHNFFDNLYVHGIYLHLALLLAIAARLGDPRTYSKENE